MCQQTIVYEVIAHPGGTNSQELFAPFSHLRAFDVVVQVVPEEVDQVDRVVPDVFGRVPREEDERDVAHALACPRVRLFETTRRVPAE